ncbi:MAG: DUF4239 domain-containing protein [Planctomycetota bacterium]
MLASLAPWITPLLFLGMLGCFMLGQKMGARRLARDPEGGREGIGAIEGAVFAFMGLLLAFTFSGATSRFDERKKLVMDEAIALGSAYQRLDLLPAAAQGELRGLLAQYVDARLAAYRKVGDTEATEAAIAAAEAIEGRIWAAAVAATASTPPSTATLVLPALDEAFDLATTRLSVARWMHPPAVIFVMLVISALLCALFVGDGMAGTRARPWFHAVGFAVMLCGSIFVILDLEYPRRGFFRVDDVDQALLQVRAAMR